VATVLSEPNRADRHAESRSSDEMRIESRPLRANTSGVISGFKAFVIREWSKHVSVFEIWADFIAAATAVLLAYFLYHELHIGTRVVYQLSKVEAVALLAGVFYVLMLKSNGAYTRATSLLRVRETERVVKASSQLCFLVFAVSFWAEVPLPRIVVLLAAISIPVLVLSDKYVIYVLSSLFMAGTQKGRRTVIYGAGLSGERVFTVLTRSPKLHLDPVAIVDDDNSAIGTRISSSGYIASREIEVSPGPISAALLRKLSAEVVVISSPSVSAEAFERISTECATVGVTLSFVPHDTIISSRSLSYWDADGLIFASIDEQEAGIINSFVKRAFDWTIALLLLLLLSPVLLAISLAIRLTSKGPALFVHERIGKNGSPFKMYKFRTMHVSSPMHSYSPISVYDPRVTKVGRFLRRTSLDELPQLLNVLKGEMSLVGPRPEMPFIVEAYSDLHRQRLVVVPGITGLWQISAGRKQLIHENIQYDLYYIRNQGFFMDLSILLHTVVFAMRGI